MPPLMPLSPSDEAAERLAVGCEHLGNVLHQSGLSTLEDRATLCISKVRQLFTYYSGIAFGFCCSSKEGLQTEKKYQEKQ